MIAWLLFETAPLAAIASEESLVGSANCLSAIKQREISKPGNFKSLNKRSY
jgi:hypothetical protein